MGLSGRASIYFHHHCYAARKSACATSLENFLLPFQRPKRPNVRYRIRHAELIIVAPNQREAPVLHAEPAAVRVVGDLRLRILQDAQTVVVVGSETDVP